MTKLRHPLLMLATFLLLAADKPPTTQPAASLAGTMTSKNKITRIAAVDREWADVLKTSEMDPKDKFLYAGTINANGEYKIDNLLPGRPYDLIIWTTAADGTITRWEGANMDYHRPITPSTAATADDRKAIESAVKDPPEFYDKVRPLRIAADHQHATVLVELERTRDFHSDAGGEVIYRVELWYFENLFGGWAKDNNTEKVLVRVRGKPKELQQNWQFLPELGGLTATTSPPASALATKAAAIALPDVPDQKHGIAGGIK